MPDEKFTEEFLRSLSEDQLAELVASFSAGDDSPESPQRELLARLAAEVERRSRREAKPPPS